MVHVHTICETGKQLHALTARVVAAHSGKHACAATASPDVTQPCHAPPAHPTIDRQQTDNLSTTASSTLWQARVRSHSLA
eukprot:6214529-Pleurochrysis_carterae.AAC.1